MARMAMLRVAGASRGELSLVSKGGELWGQRAKGLVLGRGGGRVREQDDEGSFGGG